MLNYLERIRRRFSRGTMTADKDYTGEGLEELAEISEGTEYAEVMHPDAGELQTLKTALKGHGEQTVLPDECQYGDNDLCYVES